MTVAYSLQETDMRNYTLDELVKFAKDYQCAELPISFSEDKYVRTPVYKDATLEIVVICFSPGQTSSVHDHKGSCCAVKVVKGKILEQLFKDNGEYLEFVSNKYLNQGDVSVLDGTAIHQVSCLDKSGSVLLNFYSPPSKV